MARNPHLLDLFDSSAEDICRIFEITAALKAQWQRGIREPLLPGRVLALLFEKPSLRTRVSFETAMSHLGGNAMFLGDEVGWGTREATADFARVMSQYVDLIVCRANAHSKVLELAEYSECPVVNGLTDAAHPCQALADLFTLLELRGSLDGAKLAYVGDANNVARSLAVACGKLGVTMSIASPAAYAFPQTFLEQLGREIPQLRLEVRVDPRQAVRDADAIYTDVWTSMGQESERSARAAALASYQVNNALLQHAPRHAKFLHCLPARRGEEVSDEVIDGPNSAVIQQAGNRLHLQKGLIAWLLDAPST
ncbi:MAG: ornithine carbamoyltransferase [Planctomycetes bacterium]|nr:ornithine carbamoyltransferase [Planctomycetota bacterium]